MTGLLPGATITGCRSRPLIPPRLNHPRCTCKSGQPDRSKTSWSIMQSMQAPGQDSLSLTEWVVLCLICEGATHGFAVSASLERHNDLGRIWHAQKAVVYRAIDRLEHLSYIRTIGAAHSNLGPVKSLVEATSEGRRLARFWLGVPAAHPRDVRSELLIKLALLDRSKISPANLLRRQRAQLLPITAAIEDRLQNTTGFEHTLALWRYESISATLRFLEAASAAGSSPKSSTSF